MRAGLRSYLAVEDGLEVCGEAGSLPQACVEIARHRPDIVLLDLILHDECSIGFFGKLRAAHPALKILIISMHDECTYGYRAMSEGADGYLQKDAPERDIIAAVHTVLGGGKAVSAKLAALFVGVARGEESAPDSLRLSKREFEVFQLIGAGLGTTAIADKLKVSPRTVETHKGNIKEKLGIADAAELGMRAARFLQGLPHGIDLETSAPGGGSGDARARRR